MKVFYKYILRFGVLFSLCVVVKYSYSQSAYNQTYYFNYCRPCLDSNVSFQSEVESYNSFQVLRKYKSGNQFKEFGLFTSDTTDGYEFKEVKKVWYIFQNNRWEFFFDFKNRQKKNWVIIGGDSCYFKVLGVKQINSYKTYVLKLNYGKLIKSVKTVYFFNLEKGIIAVKSNDNFYLRDSILITDSSLN